MGHAAYDSTGSDKRSAGKCPFNSEEDVWNFDAVREYGLPDFQAQISAYEEDIARTRKMFSGQLTSGGYYKTLVSGAIHTFGWDMLLLGISDMNKMERVLDSFFRMALFHMEAWAKTSVEIIIQHEDFVWTSGSFMNPAIVRKVLIPRYAELWKPLHAAGKKVLFCSDGNFMEFAGDIANAGADGFIFEPCNNFDFMADNFGQTKCLVGSLVDCRDLTLNKWERARTDIDRTLECLDKKCKGAFFAVGNHLPANIPESMLERYFEYILPKLRR
jgi:phosphoserine phosphatase